MFVNKNGKSQFSIIPVFTWTWPEFISDCFSDEEGVSSEEDVPFRDDLNDQSYDPKSERWAGGGGVGPGGRGAWPHGCTELGPVCFAAAVDFFDY